MFDGYKVRWCARHQASPFPCFALWAAQGTRATPGKRTRTRGLLIRRSGPHFRSIGVQSVTNLFSRGSVIPCSISSNPNTPQKLTFGHTFWHKFRPFDSRSKATDSENLPSIIAARHLMACQKAILRPCGDYLRLFDMIPIASKGMHAIPRK